MKYFPRKKKKRIQKINKKLIQKYPFLLPRNVWTDKVVENYDYTWNELESSIPDGWWKRFGVLLCEDLRESLINAKALNDFRILQAKEKYGELRLYDNGSPRDWDDKLAAWTYISSHTCIKCGEFPVKVRNNGWICPWCDKCYTENIKKYFKNESEDKIKEYIEETTENNFRLLEYLVISSFSKNGKEIRYIDMKPYYDKIGYKYNPGDLMSKEEFMEEMRKREENYLKNNKGNGVGENKNKESEEKD